MAGGVLRPVPLRPPADGRGRWTFDAEELTASVGPRTKLLLLNTPHNPTGKVFSRDELARIAALAVERNLLVLTDEVYEHLVFSGAEHVSIAGFPGMRERTLVVSSAGKTFNVTGWKIGWICGPPSLITAVRTAKQFLTYVNGGPFQPAIAAGLRLPDAYFTALARDLEYRRDVLAQGLLAAGLQMIVPEATYFGTVDVSTVQPDGDGLAFCRSLPQRAGVVAVPTVVFYDPAHADLGRPLVRFAFCKSDAVLGEAAQRLAHLGEGERT
jgi:N-succinyldiaminopimelate aminotransferase